MGMYSQGVVYWPDQINFFPLQHSTPYFWRAISPLHPHFVLQHHGGQQRFDLSHNSLDCEFLSRLVIFGRAHPMDDGGYKREEHGITLCRKLSLLSSMQESCQFSRAELH